MVRVTSRKNQGDGPGFILLALMTTAGVVMDFFEDPLRPFRRLGEMIMDFADDRLRKQVDPDR